MSRALIATIFCLLLTTTSAFGQGQFFWSPQSIGNGACNCDYIFKGAGPLTLYLYYTPYENISSEFDLTVSLRNESFAIIDAQMLNFDIFAGGQIFSTRWNSSDATLISSTTARFTATSQGIFGGLQAGNAGPTFTDEGYDESAKAFLVGLVTLVPTGQPVKDNSQDLLTTQSRFIDNQVIEVFPSLPEIFDIQPFCNLTAINYPQLR